MPEPTARAGFIEIEPITYVNRMLANEDEQTSTRTRLFYNLLPADSDAKTKPVFVLFNGGPGAATSLLRSFGTGPRTLDVAAQFGWQILLEPVVAGSFQFEEAQRRLADMQSALAVELGLEDDELGERCGDDFSRTQAWCDALRAAVDRVSLDAAEFEAFTRIAVGSVPKLAPSERGEAFRLMTAQADPLPDPLGLGPLDAWDRYYLPDSVRGPGSFTFYTSTSGASFFAYSAAYVNTLITNGHFDTHIVPESIVPALRQFATLSPSFGLSEVRYGGDDPETPADTILLRFERSEVSTTRTLYFPSFPRSGHYVSVSEAERLHATVAQFLSNTGL